MGLPDQPGDGRFRPPEPGGDRPGRPSRSGGRPSAPGEGVGVAEGVGDDREDLLGEGLPVRELLVELATSARRAGRGAVVSGRWLADVVTDLAPRVPVRDAATLSAHHGGLTGPALGRALVRSAGRVSAGVAAATGTLIAAQQLSVVTVVLVPAELAAETAVVVSTELKLVTELHEVAGRRLPGGPLERSRAALAVWVSGHAAAEHTTAGRGGALPGRPARRELSRALRSRFARNLTTLGPVMTGAVAAGVLNRQATVRIGRAVARDLRLGR